MAMPTPNIGALRAVAERLDQLKLNFAFVGGSIVNLLLDDPGFCRLGQPMTQMSFSRL
jgi:hypothetical protein